jgi:hemerythrin-like domain-containing protein
MIDAIVGRGLLGERPGYSDRMPAALPPLPPAFRVDDDDVRPGGRNALDVLVDDHHQISALCDRVRESATAGDDRVRAVTDVLVAALSRHLSAEEQYLYPTVRGTPNGGVALAEAELAEDAEMLRTLRRLHRTPVDDAGFLTAVDMLTQQVRRHVRRASREVFPRLRERCSDNELVRLGNRVEIAHEAAPTRPHPATPVTPPANKLVDPALGVVDKVRDALTGRVTRPEDL